MRFTDAIERLTEAVTTLVGRGEVTARVSMACQSFNARMLGDLNSKDRTEIENFVSRGRNPNLTEEEAAEIAQQIWGMYVKLKGLSAIPE